MRVWALALLCLHACTSLCTSPGGVEIFSTPGCRYCARAKGFLKKRGVPFEDFDVSEDEELLKTMLKRAGKATLPQIFIAGDHVGGCTDMLGEEPSGTLAARLEKIGILMVDPPEDEPARSAKQARGGCCLRYARTNSVGAGPDATVALHAQLCKAWPRLRLTNTS